MISLKDIYEARNPAAILPKKENNDKQKAIHPIQLLSYPKGAIK